MNISDSIGPTLIGKRIVLGVTGSIAAYKAVALLRTLIREGAVVQVVMTQSATKFVTPLTFEVLSGHPVSTDIFEAHQEMKHLSLPAQADAIVIAPATANCLAKAALGLGDDLLSTMLLTSQCPLVVAPAMDGGMWTHPSVQEHVKTLRARGTVVVNPEIGPLASGQTGQGRLAEEGRISGGPSSGAGSTTRLARAPRSGLGRPDARADRSGAVYFEPLFRQDGLCGCRSCSGKGSTGGSCHRPYGITDSERRRGCVGSHG